MCNVQYGLQTINTANPVARYAHRARLGRSVLHDPRMRT
jgi:hypothetical protein